MVVIKKDNKGDDIALDKAKTKPTLARVIAKRGKYVTFRKTLAENEGIIFFNSTKYTTVDKGQLIKVTIYANS